MRVVYEWTQSEWDEAIRLAAARNRRGSGVSGITYGVILVPLIGGGISGLLALRHNERLGVAGTILPLLAGLVGLCVVLWIVGAKWRLQHLRAAAGPMPTGECEAVMQEAGWRFCTVVSAAATDAAECTAGTQTDVDRPEVTAATPALTPWSSMYRMRDGTRVVVFLHHEGFGGVPMRCLNEEQVGHVQRLIARKLRPHPVQH